MTLSNEPPKANHADKTIFEKIPLIMAAVGAVAKSKQLYVNDKPQYNYRGVDDVYAALQSLLSEHGVFTAPKVLSDSTEERTTKYGGVLIYRKLTIEYTFYATDGTNFTATVVGEGMDSGDKASNKAMSVAHKYALLQVFCIPTDDPKDPETEHHEVAPKQEKYPEREKSQEVRYDYNQPTAPKAPNPPAAAAKPDLRPNPAKAGEPISEAQGKRLFALSKSAGWDINEVKDYISLQFGYTSTKDIQRKDYEKICGFVQSNSPEDALRQLGRERAGDDRNAPPPFTDSDIPF